MLEDEKKRQATAKARSSSKPFATTQSEAKKKQYQQAQLANAKQTTQQATQKTNWYKGETPTSREALARIYEIGKTDREKARDLTSKFRELQSDSSSMYYNPYTSATTSKNTQTNRNNTIKAQDEWARLSDELSYWATRTDRNYSDEEILNRINWDNYKTLQKMDEGRKTGNPLALLDAVGYSEDAMYGVMWAARNPGKSAGTAEYDAVQSVLGRGNQYKANDVSDYRDATGGKYAPYKAGATALDDLAYKYGMPGDFTREWLDGEGKALLNGDAQSREDYTRIYNVVTGTEAVEKEANAFYEKYAKPMIEAGVDPAKIFYDGVFEDLEYKNLAKFVEGAKSGDLYETAYAVGFDYDDLVKQANEYYAKTKGSISNTDYEQQLATSTGGNFFPDEGTEKSNEAKQLNTDILLPDYAPVATESERSAFRTTANAGYYDVVGATADFVQNGSGGEAEYKATAVAEANNYANENLFSAMDDLGKAEELLNSSGMSKEEVESFLETNFNDMLEEDEYPTGKDVMNAFKEGKLAFPEGMLPEDQGEYIKKVQNALEASRMMDESQSAIDDVLDGLADAYGEDTDAYRTVVATYSFAYDYEKAPQKYWAAYDEYQLFSQEDGVSPEDMDAYLENLRGSYGREIKHTKALIENSEELGIPKNYIQNIQKYLADLESRNELLKYHDLPKQDGYVFNVTVFDKINKPYDIKQAFSGEEVTRDDLIRYLVTDLASSMAFLGGHKDMGEMANFVSVMTEEELSNYKYLYMKEGAESATKYFDDLSRNLRVRFGEDLSGRSKKLGETPFVPTTAMSFAAVPFESFSGAAVLLSKLFGQEMDPYSPLFFATRIKNSLRTGSKEAAYNQFEKWWGGDNTAVADWLYGTLYDAATSGGDSMIVAAIGGLAGGGTLGTKITTGTMNAMTGFSSGAMDASLRGAEDWQAFAYGLANAAIEAFTESDQVGKVLDAFSLGSKNGKESLAVFLRKSFFSEGGEELISAVLGNIPEDFIMGELSNRNAAIQQYMAEEKLTKKEAEMRANKDILVDALYQSLVGGISGFMSSGTSYAVGNVLVSSSGNLSNSSKPTSRTTGTSRATVTKTSPQTKTEKSSPAKSNGDKERAMSALNTSMKQGVSASQQTATVSGVLQSYGMSDIEANAAAKRIADSGNTRLLNKMLSKTTNPELLMKAFAMGQVVDNSACAAVLNKSINSNNIHRATNELLKAYASDAANGRVTANYDAKVASSAESDAVAAQVTQTGALDHTAVDNARAALEDANEQLGHARDEETAAHQAVANANAKFNQNPADTQAKAELKSAIDKQNAAQKKRSEAENRVNVSTKKLDAEKQALNAKAEEFMGIAREQAKPEVQQHTEQLNTQKAEQKAAAEVKRQNDNVLAMQADSFVNTYFADATDEQKQVLRDRYMSYNGQTRDVTRGMAEFASLISKKFNLSVKFTDSHDIFEAAYTGGNQIVLDKNATQGDVIKRVLVHEITHAAETSKSYDALADAVLEAYYGDNQEQIEVDIAEKAELYSEVAGQDGESVARSELVADRLAEMLSGNQEAMNRLVEKQPNVATRIWRELKRFIGKLTGVRDPELDKLINLEKQLEKALATRGAKETVAFSMPQTQDGKQHVIAGSSGEPAAEIIRGGATKFSLSSWTEKEKSAVRKALTEAGYDPENVGQWIDDVNSVAAIIAGDKARLDYTADPDQVMLKNNQEYVKTLDASTLCAKRLLYQGTFNEIQHQLPNTVITSDMLLDLLNMMKDAGYESPCGVCYVESRRRHLGKYAQEWLDEYDGAYKPSLDEVTTTDGLERLKATHPETYESFIAKMNSLGSSNPKVVELRTDYRGDIRRISKQATEKIVKIGGLRVQSFSDFETPHLIDMMQAVLDMAGKKLTSQAYTKVPNFAWVFGDTGIKINLSLLAEGNGLDENGNLIFSSSEGMDFEEAMRLRDRYSQNVGTIIVGANDAHIRAAMADPRIDYIIPFHRSGWGQNELKKVGVLQTYTDYQANQNERKIIGYAKNGKPKYESPSSKKFANGKWENFYPIDYWDYSKTGDENAATYLRMCEEDGRIPKFEQFLEKDADGHWVAPSGYWKMLIDFKMYDNDGNGAPQQTVQPNFNMEEAVRVLGEYEGGADSLPVAYDIADRFVSEYKSAKPGVKFSLKAPVEETRDMIAVHNLHEKTLLQTLALGGFPSPSTAVVKAKSGHTSFGPISVIFNKNAIDPNVDARNKLYGGDAYTPTFPEADAFDRNPETIDKIKSKQKDLRKKFGATVARAVGDLAKRVNRGMTASEMDELVSDLMLPGNEGLKIAYLADSGESTDLVNAFGKKYLYDRNSLNKRINNKVYLGHDGYVRWLNEMLQGVRNKPMYRNEVPEVGKRGKTRKFQELYDHADAENVTEKMLTQPESSALLASALQRYDSIEELKADSERLDAEGYKSVNHDKMVVQFVELMEEHSDRDAYSNMSAMIDILTRYRNGENLESLLEESGRFERISEMLPKLEKLIEGVRNSPVKYFEAKPNHVVGFEQVVTILIPDDSSNELRNELDKRGILYEEYERNNDEMRLALMNGGIPESARFSLPSNDILDQRIAQHRNSQLASAQNGMIPGGGEQEQNYGTGERQFVAKTLPGNPNIPQWAVDSVTNNPKARYYNPETNMEQAQRGWERIQTNGIDAEVERLLNADHYTADDTMEADMLMAMAMREDSPDPALFFALSEKYGEDSTETARALQAHKAFSKLTPSGATAWFVGKAEQDFKEHMRTHKPQKDKVDAQAKSVADQIRDMQSGDELRRLNAGGDFTIDESNNRWGVPLNEQQLALIDHYKLNKVTRPGDFYNRATSEQRMLEAIIATPNPLEATGLGLNLIQRLEYIKHGEKVATVADMNYIFKQLGAFVGLGEENGGREADVALARAYEAYGNIAPAKWLEKFRTQRYVNMLLSIPSFTRNFIGNGTQNVVNAAAHGVAVEIDKMLYKRTGVRKFEHLDAAERIAGWNAFVKETRNTFRDYFVDKVDTSPNRNKYDTNRRGRTFQNGLQESMKNLESLMMSVGDRNVWKKAYINSLAEQQKLADKGLLRNDDGTSVTHEQMLERAERDANYATFTEDNLISNMVGYLSAQNKVAADVLSFYTPFTGVPTNVMKRSFEYSPIGFVTCIGRKVIDHCAGRNFNQEAFVNDLARAFTGSALLAAGVILGSAGFIKMGSGDEEEGNKVYDAKTAMGVQYTPYFTNPATGENISMSTFAPALSPLVWGASISEAFKNDEERFNILLNAMFSATDSIFNASYLSGLSDILGGYGSITENIVHVGVENLVSQSIPALLTQTANALDSYVRDTKDKNFIIGVLKTTANRIPFLRNAVLPKKVTVSGETVATKGAASFVDPLTRSTPSKNAALTEAMRLYEVLGTTDVLPSDALRGKTNTISLKVDGVKMKAVFTDKQKEEYKLYYGNAWTSAVDVLMTDPNWEYMSDAEKGEKFKKILEAANKETKTEFLRKYGHKVEE